jgi:hypothetical protein
MLASKLKDSLTENSYIDYFTTEKNFLSVFVSATRLQWKQKPVKIIIPVLTSLIISTLFTLLAKNEINAELLFNYSKDVLSITGIVLSFTLIAFSLIIAIANTKLSIWMFCIKDRNYQIPPLKILLLHFCYPITLFLFTFLFSIAIITIGTLDISIQKYSCMFDTINYSVFWLLLSVFIYSLIELLAFLYNIFAFNVIYFGKLSEITETEIMYKVSNNKKMTFLELYYFQYIEEETAKKNK